MSYAIISGQILIVDGRNGSFRIGDRKVRVSEQCGKAGYLFQAEQFVPVHADVPHDPLVGHSGIGKFSYDVCHQSDIVCTSGTVVTDGGTDAVRQILVDDNN